MSDLIALHVILIAQPYGCQTEEACSSTRLEPQLLQLVDWWHKLVTTLLKSIARCRSVKVWQHFVVMAAAPHNRAIREGTSADMGQGASGAQQAQSSCTNQSGSLQH